MAPHRPADPGWIRIAERAYAFGLRLLPARFRHDYADCLRQAFRDRCREVARGERGAFRVLVLELAPDLLMASGREHMHAGLDPRSPRHAVLVGCFCLALAGLGFKDAITPPVLDAAVAIRNRYNDAVDLRHIEAQEANTRRIAEQLASGPDAGSKALAALLYRSIAQRKENPYWAPDNQNEAIYHRLPVEAVEENTRIRHLVAEVLQQPHAGEFALMRAAESCDPQDGCDRTAVISRLEQTAPGNGYAWVLAFAHADARHDEAGERAALAQLANAGRYDAHEGTTAARLIDATAASGVGGDEATVRLARNVAWLGLLGSHSWIGGYCIKRTRAGAPDDALRGDCLRAFALMSRSSQLGASIQGWRGLLRLDDDPQLFAQARTQLRDRFWLGGTVFEQDRMYTDLPQDTRSTSAWPAAFHPGDGEIPSLRRWFIARGLPARAPSRYVVPDAYVVPKLD
ncbi:MAG TPA: hypothetical protein VHL61_08685 [Luteimonas sp.]|nr:hypothetical protein [Luteimonas sp.]